MTDEDAERADSFGENIVEMMFTTWVDAELTRRGDGLKRADVGKAVIELPPFGATPIVRLNADAALEARAIVSAPIAKGEAVTPENVRSLEAFWPVGIHADSGWLAYIVVGASGYVAFDFRYNKQRNAELLSLADDYLETAQGYYELALRPAIDNLLSAAELTVQAQMLVQSEQTTFHNIRDTWLRDNERLGNAPEGFFALLKQLRSERAAARYGDGVVSISADEMPELIARVRTMIEHATGRTGLVAVDPSATNN